MPSSVCSMASVCSWRAATGAASAAGTAGLASGSAVATVWASAATMLSCSLIGASDWPSSRRLRPRPRRRLRPAPASSPAASAACSGRLLASAAWSRSARASLRPLALATFRPFGAFRTLGALAFGTAVAAHVLAAAFGAFSAVAARFIAAVAVAVRAMAFAAAVLAVVAALAAAGGAALGGVFLGSGVAAGLALSPLPVSQPTRRLNRPPRPPEAAGAGAAAAGAGAGVDTGAGCEGVMPLTSASGRLLISCSRGCQAASVDGASTSSKLVFTSSRRGSS